MQNSHCGSERAGGPFPPLMWCFSAHEFRGGSGCRKKVAGVGVQGCRRAPSPPGVCMGNVCSSHLSCGPSPFWRLACRPPPITWLSVKSPRCGRIRPLACMTFHIVLSSIAAAFFKCNIFLCPCQSGPPNFSARLIGSQKPAVGRTEAL